MPARPISEIRLVNGSAGDPLLFIDYPGKNDALLFDAGENGTLDAKRLGDLQAVFITLWPTYCLLGLGKALDSDLLFHIGGIFGIATAACAWYTSFALTANHTTRRSWLPVGKMRSAQQDTAA